MVGVVSLAVALREHYGHVLGYAPYLLLLACPLMHLFHRHGHHADHPPASDATPKHPG
jgi:hypothetical protein